MIIAHLAGGLGNQMFQYAMARQVALDLGVELRLDLFSYRSDRLRHPGLFHMHIAAEQARWLDVFRLCPAMALSRLWPRPLYERGWQQLVRLGIKPSCRTRFDDDADARAPLRQGNIVAERQMTYDAASGQVSDNCLLVGFWLQENYFTRIRANLLAEFQLKKPPTSLDADIIQRMHHAESVALHVRRDDKVGRSEFKATSLEYCQKAMAIMRERLQAPHFFVFSDAADWTHQHLGQLPDVTLISHHDRDHPHEDLRLMKSCRHQIIAASSLSWWAAWLNDRQAKIVLSPPASHWFQHPRRSSAQILPREWIEVDAPGD